MKTNKVVLLSAFKYVVSADYETWFENLAANGWYPKNIGNLVYHLHLFYY